LDAGLVAASVDPLVAVTADVSAALMGGPTVESSVVRSAHSMGGLWDCL